MLRDQVRLTENHSGSGRLCLEVTTHLLDGNTGDATSLLQQLAADPKAAHLRNFVSLQAIVAGSRDRSLASEPELHYTMAAEILLLIERLEQPR